MTQAGYSGTPLPRKLGIEHGDGVCVLNDPGHAAELIAPLPSGARFGVPASDAEVVLLFTTERDEVAQSLEELGQAIFPDRSLWIAWPKRTSGVPTNVTEDVIRELALPLGLVDNKVCAIDSIWSGLRLVWRRELRRT